MKLEINHMEGIANASNGLALVAKTYAKKFGGLTRENDEITEEEAEAILKQETLSLLIGIYITQLQLLQQGDRKIIKAPINLNSH